MDVPVPSSPPFISLLVVFLAIPTVLGSFDLRFAVVLVAIVQACGVRASTTTNCVLCGSPGVRCPDCTLCDAGIMRCPATGIESLFSGPIDFRENNIISEVSVGGRMDGRTTCASLRHRRTLSRRDVSDNKLTALPASAFELTINIQIMCE